MSTRLAQGGRLLNKGKQLYFSFNGKQFTGFEGDTLASALLANDQLMMGRSFKYHRPRGPVASGAEEPNALVNLGKGGTFEPNQRATTTELFNGLTCESQNHWPSLEFDVGAVNNYMTRFFPAGFYYKTFMFPRAAWKHVFEPIVRQSAGLGKVPKDRDADRYDRHHGSTRIECNPQQAQGTEHQNNRDDTRYQRYDAAFQRRKHRRHDEKNYQQQDAE